MAKEFKTAIGLLGNPNVGKSTLFNALTGAQQHMGNWPGKTVEQTIGQFNYQNQSITLIDLPGTYSLNAYTDEEAITLAVIKRQQLNVIIQIIDAQNLARNLFLTLQLLESQVHLIIALNMYDLARASGIEIKVELLAELLGVTVVVIDAKKKTGLTNLIASCLTDKKHLPKLTYPRISSDVRRRYGYINGLLKQVVTAKTPKNYKNFSDQLDALTTNKYWGIPLFLLTIFIVFQLTFFIANPLVNAIKYFITLLNEQITQILHLATMPDWIISLVTKGILGGVGSILTFIPVLAMLFLALAVLEDSGYMARVAYIMDRVMRRLGLHGKAFLPLIIGFGCNVPAIMATRTLETKKDRLLTMLICPFISCGARLPIYVLFTAAFFPKQQGWILFSLYLLGIVMAISAGLVLKNSLFKKVPSPLVIELPPYRWPVLSHVLLAVWKKIKLFFKKTGKIILIVSLIIWFLATMPFGVAYGSQNSIIGIIGQWVTPLFSPLGFAHWQTMVALMFGIVAKEVVVSTFGTLITNLSDYFTPLSAYSFMVFVLLYTPCLSTLAAVKQETNSWRWPIFMAVYTFIIAWLAALVIYQGGRLLVS